MIAFPAMLVPAAEKAGMKVPPNVDKFKPAEYPHFQVFCVVQLGRPTRPGEHWTNAEVIAKIPDDKIMKVDIGDLLALGIAFSS